MDSTAADWIYSLKSHSSHCDAFSCVFSTQRIIKCKEALTKASPDVQEAQLRCRAEGTDPVLLRDYVFPPVLEEILEQEQFNHALIIVSSIFTL